MSTKYPVGLPQHNSVIGERDAIHMPVVVATCNRMVSPGMFVQFTCRSKVVIDFDSGDVHGIVDPFLTQQVKTGTPFLVFIYPHLTTPPRHEFGVKIPVMDQTEEKTNEDEIVEDDCKWCN